MTDALPILDLSGLKCPLPVLRTRKAMRALEPGARLTILCTDPVSVIDIPHLVSQEGDRLVGQGREEGVFCFTIEKGGAGA
ncbi:sulfurtransferase TusA family protein [Methylobacterium sp. 77]|uniref:sulfurtransferase TusA family protein n=1 Tax=Methylobacterium sp. 77 TaxID=1101192 RepID=UPI000372A898|nr:sulfurtransferase TusA family protein [Methylobacterium sp. 77]